MIRRKSISSIFTVLIGARLGSSSNAISSIEHFNGVTNVIEDHIAGGGTAVVTRNLIGAIWNQLGTDFEDESNGDGNNRLGAAVAMSGDGKRMAAGAPGNDDDGEDGGHVCVYEWIDGGWELVGSAINGKTGEFFGSSVALSRNGNRVAIGGKDESGIVRVYDYNGSTWLQAGIDIFGEIRNVNQISLSSNGNRFAIGSDKYDSNKGQVRVFYWDETTRAWIMEATLDGKDNGKFFGTAISLSGDGKKLAVGSEEPSQVQVYEVKGGTSVGDQIVKGPKINQFGKPLSLSEDGNRLALRSKPDSDSRGVVKVFELGNSEWTQVGEDLIGDDDNDLLGFSLDLSRNGKRLAVGARGSPSDGTNKGSGYAKVFDWNATTAAWTQVGHKIFGNNDTDNSRVVALSADGKKLVIGAPQHAEGAGQVRVFLDSSEDGTYGNITDQISQPSVNATSASEYAAFYNIVTNGTYKFDISYSDDCNTPIVDNPITLQGNIYEFNQTSEDVLDVTMLLNLTMLAEAEDQKVYYLTEDRMYAEIHFCLTVELHKDPNTMNLYHNTSNENSGYVAYRSTVISTTLDLSQEFAGSITVEDITTADFQDPLTPDLQVASYMCHENGTEIEGDPDKPLYTNEEFHFCVDATSLKYAKIDSIKELKFSSPNEWIYTPINEGKKLPNDELIEDPKFTADEQTCIMGLAFLPVQLFSSVKNDKFTVGISGTVILKFGARMLQVSFESASGTERDRELEQSSDAASFESMVEFTKNEIKDDDGGTQSGMYIGITVGSILVVGVVLMISFKRRKSKNTISNVEACDLVEVRVDSGTKKGGVST